MHGTRGPAVALCYGKKKSRLIFGAPAKRPCQSLTFNALAIAAASSYWSRPAMD